MMCYVLKLSLLKRDKKTEGNHLPFLSSNELGFREMFWHVKANVFWKREPRCEKRGSLVSMVYKNWQTNKASVMSKIKIKKKYISTGEMEDLGFDFVLSLGWRNSRSSHLPVWKQSEESDSLCQRKRKEEKKGCHRGVGRRKRGRGGQVGIVSRVPLSIHSPWFLFGLLGGW